MLKRIFAFLLASFALTLSVDANAASAYYTPRINLTALANLGAASAATAHATVVDSSGGLHNYDWTPGDCSPDGATYVAAVGVVTSGAGSGCWVAQETFFSPTVRTGPFSVANANIPFSCVAWGDSLTQGVGGATPWPTYWDIYSGRTCSNQGAGGQTSTQIAVREGAWNGLATATVTGGAVPASGPVAVTFTYGYEPLTNQGPTSVNASVGGVPGAVSRSGANFTGAVSGTVLTASAVTGTLAVGQELFPGLPGTFITSLGSGTGGAGTYNINLSQTVVSQAMYSSAFAFTRTSSGSSTPVSTPTALVVNVGALNNGLVFIWVGRNDLNNCSGVLTNIAAMVAALSGNQNYRVISIPNGAGEGVGTGTYNTIIACDNSMAAAYPGHYLDLRGYEANAIPLPGEFTINCATGHCTSQALVDAGINPSSQDFLDLAANIPPSSLRQDALHPNDAGNAILAQRNVLAAANSVLAMMVGVGTTNPQSPVDVLTPLGRIELASNGSIYGGGNGNSFTVTAGGWTNGNIVLDPTGTGSLLLNADSGTGQTIFYNGAGSQVAAMNSAGQLSLGSTVADKNLTVNNGTTDNQGIHVLSVGAHQPIIFVEDSADSSILALRLAGGASVLGEFGGTSTAGGLTDLLLGTDAAGPVANAFLDVSRTATTATLNDALTTTFNSPFAVSHSTSGTAAAGLGSWVPWNLENASGTLKNFGQVGFGETVATAGSEDGNFLVQGMISGTLGNMINFTRSIYRFGATTAFDTALAANSRSTYILSPYANDNVARTAMLDIVGFGTTGPSVNGVMYGGTVSVPAAVGSGVNIFTNTGLLYNGTSAVTAAQALFQTTEVAGATNGVMFQMALTPTGSATRGTIQKVWGDGHFQFLSAALPAATSCGTSPAVASGSSDSQGVVTEGSVATGCTITFATAYLSSPSCTVTAEVGALTYAVTTTAITVTNVGALSSSKIHYHCQGNG